MFYINHHDQTLIWDSARKFKGDTVECVDRTELDDSRSSRTTLDVYVQYPLVTSCTAL